MNEKLEAIRDASAASFHKLFTEALPDIESAMVAAASEAESQEQEAKLSIGFTVKLNLDKNAIQYRLSFGVKPLPRRLRADARPESARATWG